MKTPLQSTPSSAGITRHRMSPYSCVPPEREVIPAPERSSKGFCVCGPEPKFVRLKTLLRRRPRNRLDTGRPHNAAVTVLRGNGGTFPSQAHKSDPKGVQERAEGPVIAGSSCKSFSLSAKRYRKSPITTDVLNYRASLNLHHAGLGEYCPMQNPHSLGVIQGACR